MMKKKSTLTRIVRRCLEIDVQAVDVYGKFMAQPLPGPVKKLFRTLMSDETRHVAYWRGLLERVRQGAALELFEDPETVLLELDMVAKTALSFQQDLLKRPPEDAASLILAAIRMEYVLLHPSFLVLFDFAHILPGRRTMENEYADHMDHLCGALNAQGAENPMFPLFGELLRRVWHETKRLVRLNQSDPLSGVLNRRGFHSQLRPLLYLARRNRYPVAVMIIDIDRFKRVNDKYGHQAGDKLIRLVSDAVTKGVRRSDVVARVGGDEFAVFLPDARPEALNLMARAIKAELEARTAPVARTTVSIGIASAEIRDDPERALVRLMQEADRALYEVKKAGRNGYRLRQLSGGGQQARGKKNKRLMIADSHG